MGENNLNVVFEKTSKSFAISDFTNTNTPIGKATDIWLKALAEAGLVAKNGTFDGREIPIPVLPVHAGK